MSLLVKFYTIVVSEAVADRKRRGGAARLVEHFKGALIEGVIRWVVMSPADADRLVQRLERHGLTAPRSGADSEVAILDMMRGPLAPCDWLEVFGGGSEPMWFRLLTPRTDLFADVPDHVVAADAATTVPPGLVSLLEYVRADERVSPLPIPWNDFWKALKARAGGCEPPLLPLVLSAWYATNDASKQARLREQLEWADRNDLIWVADALLRDLTPEQWHRHDPQLDRLDHPGPGAGWGDVP